jgi:acetoin utilization protein AcuB
MNLRDLMNPRPVTASPDEAAGTAWERMHALRTDHLVVVQDGRVVGVVSRHDLGGPGGGDGRLGRPIKELMHADDVVVSPMSSVRRAAMLMRKHGIACVPVVECEQLVGIVTVGHLLELLEREQEI